MKTKDNQNLRAAVVIVALVMIAIGSWGILNSYNTSAIWRTIGAFQYPKIEYTAEKLYFSYGAFVTILSLSVFVLFSALIVHAPAPKTQAL